MPQLGAFFSALTLDSDMLSLEQLKKGDPSLATMSDEELVLIRRELYEFAQLAFDVWHEGENGSKNPLGLLQDSNPIDMVKL